MSPSPSRAQTGWAVLCAVAGIALITALMAIKGPIPYDNPAFADYDHMSYLAMAESGLGAPGKASAPPFCWRILTPLIAGALPLPAPGAFFFLSFSLLSACAFGTYLLLFRSGFGHALSLAGEISFFSYFWGAGFHMWNYLMVDPLSLLLFIVGLIVLGENELKDGVRLGIVGALVAVGALNKESCLLLAVAAFVHTLAVSRSPIPRRILIAALPALPGVVILLLIRNGITADYGQMKEFGSYGLAEAFRTMVADRLRHLPRWIFEVFIDPWGPLVLVPFLLHPADALAWGRKHLHLVVFAGAAAGQSLFGTSGGRLAIVAVPVMVLWSMERVGLLLGGRRLRIAPFALLMLLQFLAQYPRRTTLGLSIPPYDPNPAVTVMYGARAIAFALFAATWIFLARRPTEGGGPQAGAPDRVTA